MPRKAATMADVARRAQVTAMTVSRAFKSDSSISDETRKRIMAAADEIGYVMDGTAASLRIGRSGFVAVVIPTLNNSNFAETVQGIIDALEGTKLQVLLGYTNYDRDTEEEIIASMLTRRPEAIVLTGGDHTDRSRRLLSGSGIPVVEMWALPDDPIEHSVGFDNAEAGAMLTRHLQAAGYRKIGFIGGTTDRDVRGVERRRGYERAIAVAGVQLPRVAAFGEPPMTMMQGPGALDLLLARWPDTDAVICVSDLIAFGVLGECQRRGIVVPGQLAIAGFGNYDVSQCATPPLTTVDVQARQIGTEVARLLRESVSDGKAAPRSVSLLPAVLPRQSS
jgi:LacI family gluconate utilization system Gnt-I transcriptional repressor